MSVEEIKKNIKDCDVYVTCWGSQRLDKEILDCAPNLKLLTHVAGTVVPFVSDEMWERGIRVICGNDYFAESVAEGTIAYMLSSLRMIPFYSTQLMEKGIWAGGNDPSDSLIYKKVGLISYGAIAKHLVKKLLPFNVEVLVYDIVDIPKEEQEKYNFRQASMDEIFSTCEIVSLHTPLNEHTHHLIGDKQFSQMRDGALFVNTSRGAVVDQAALTRHLKTGRCNAMLDVLEKEPIDKDDELLTLPNVLLMPHRGGPTINLRKVITKNLLIESRDFIDFGKELLEKDEISAERARMMSRS
jgi:phosphoglycerate dehydrogenase-like enzyme